jgi:hypothetical protein
MQSGLNVLQSAYKELTVDGRFGPKTLERVYEFQQKAYLARDGIVGPQTWLALSTALSAAGYMIDKIKGVVPNAVLPPWAAGMSAEEYAFRAKFLDFCQQEVSQQYGIRRHAWRIRQYMEASSVAPFTPDPDERKQRVNMAHRSWCSDYVYFCLQSAGHPRMPVRNNNNANKDEYGSIARFANTYPRTENPRPGDLYLMPFVNGKRTDHIGVFMHWGEHVYAPKGPLFRSLDGNSIDWQSVPPLSMCQTVPDPTPPGAKPTFKAGSYFNASNMRSVSNVEAFLSVWGA